MATAEPVTNASASNDSRPREEFLDRKRYLQACASNALMEVAERAAVRAQAHFAARILCRQGKFAEALPALHAVIQEHGEHIRIWGNIAMCHYHLGQPKAWAQAVTRFRDVYEKQKNRLELATLDWVELNLAKYSEELGEISEAIAQYCALAARTADLSMGHRVRAQLLRIYAEFGMLAPAHDLCRELMSLKLDEPSVYAGFEVQHALTLASLPLMGPAHARARLRALTDDENFDEAEKSLVMHDLAEQLAFFAEVDAAANRSGEMTVPADLISQSPFESFVRDFAPTKAEFAEDHLRRLVDLAQSTPPAGMLRVVALARHRAGNPALRGELGQHLDLLLGALSEPNRVHWRKKFAMERTVATAPVLTLRGTELISAAGAVRFERYPVLLAMVRALDAKVGAVNHDELIAAVWGDAPGSDRLDRVRMNAARINALIAPLLGGANWLRVSKAALHLSVELRVVDDAAAGVKIR